MQLYLNHPLAGRVSKSLQSGDLNIGTITLPEIINAIFMPLIIYGENSILFKELKSLFLRVYFFNSLI